MTDRFDLEQQLLKFSSIMDDIRDLNLDNAHVDRILNYYDFKFENLWATFEQMVRDEHRKNHGAMTLKQMQAVTRLEVIDGDGRSYSKWNIQNKSFSFQDEGRTLKIFLDLKGEASSEDLSDQT